MSTATSSKLAINGGPKAVTKDFGDMFDWPIVTKEDEDAVLNVMRNDNMSGTNITKEFEKEFAAWNGTEYALTACNGTESIKAGMWACGVGAGDEIIGPSMTYWASCAPALMLGAAVNFADIDRESLCIDPKDIEHRIGPKTKLIVCVHYAGYPCDMDPIMEIAKKHNIKVMEDVSHAQGGFYKGRKLGTIGDLGCMSMMSGKSFATGEGGIMVTNDRTIYERSIAFGHYEKTGVATDWADGNNYITLDELKPFSGFPLGASKHRINQCCSAMGRVQLKHYDARIKEIQEAAQYFWSKLEGVPGVKPHWPKDEGSTMAGLYAAHGLYYAEELGGLSCEKFCDAVKAEVAPRQTNPGANKPMHLHPLFHDADIFRMGKPTMISFGQRDVRQGPGTLPVTESIADICYYIPWFKHNRPEIIDEYAAAFRKVAENADELK
ncbi:MAG: DegT/DnrJ/EryC1/StrS aminotransferase family protein [Planctomycetota bacterium]|jgi:dTDP-4-amino-4,6-dideoxygalactose transaminase